ncbi:5-methyltetrahydrofolate-homocysteine methyltransferase reductase [Capsaspora owczarzaki ATCC 30864]|uniref:5-methyltetrahydrofolate-homocysteine methyltransferase reductase n=1 Tax=Capsaspora owczarzaki (strain ATCC 30864) TaxID=595528 RepID=A0A0D2UH07_CAPO3|nr:5-methyltetrahydrofolate-homocysteine methyltransferase reductase [Capsaspora owczarzaki ATCC 30864]
MCCGFWKVGQHVSSDLLAHWWCGFGRLQLVVEPWTEKLWPALAAVVSEMAGSTGSTSATLAQNSSSSSSADAPSVAADKSSPSAAAPAQPSVGSSAPVVAADAPVVPADPAGLPRLPTASITLALRTEPAVDLLTRLNGRDLQLVGLKSVSRLTSLTSNSDRTVLQAVVDITNTALSDGRYSPGDAFGVFCPNDTARTHELLSHLGAKFDQSVDLTPAGMAKELPVHIPAQATLGHLFSWCIDVRSAPKKTFLRTLAEYATNPLERHRILTYCSREGSAIYETDIRTPCLDLLDVLRSFPSCRPPVERIIEALPPLQPRYYSAASAPLAHPNELHFAFTVASFSPVNGGLSASRSTHGLATHWFEQQMLSNLPADQLPRVPLFVRPVNDFHPPTDVSKPLIMVGPGTGVAPFIGFLHERRVQRERFLATLSAESDADKAAALERAFGRTTLFFGCRNQKHDFLYEEQLRQLVACGALTSLHVCFSRDVPESGTATATEPSATDAPIDLGAAAASTPASTPAAAAARVQYVQDNMLLHYTEVLDGMMRHDGVLFVCGDAKNMAKDVHDTLGKLLVLHEGQSSDQATALLSQWSLSKRYLRDVWA